MAYQVFISFKRNALDGSGKTRDYELAADLHKTLKARGIETFFSEKDLSTSKFRDEIDTALEEARILVVVGTSRAHLESENVKYEWRAFHEDMLNGIKPNGQLYTYLEGMPQTHLPLALRHYQSFLSNQKELLVHFIMENLGIQDVPSHPQPTQDTTSKPAPQPAPQPQPVSYPSPVSYSTRPIQNISQPVSQPAARKSVKSTPLIVTVAVVLVIAMVSGIWAVSNSKSNSTSESSEKTGTAISEENLNGLDATYNGSYYTFTFGHYPQGEDGEEQPIEWRVLAVEDGKALVISEKLLDYVPYNREYTDVTWETCTLRTWMNNGFLNNAFNSDEQAKLVTITNQNPNNPTYGTEGGNATQDRIFALSIDEAKKYFSSDSDRKAYTTDYTHKKEYDHDDRSEWWWLRSPGNYSYDAGNVRDGGDVDQHGYDVNLDSVAVRPAFWLNL